MASLACAQDKPSVAINPSGMAKVGTVDPRYLSFNVEMVEVTGGRFWKPYKSQTAAPDLADAAHPLGPSQQVGGAQGPFQYRPPIDLSRPRLRKLAAALGPAYMRVSGTWENTTYFQNDDLPALKKAPDGFNAVLTRAEWKGVIDFAHAVDAELVTSFAISPGTRDAAGAWTPTQAKALLDYTRDAGGSIAAAEFMNEPNFPGPGGAPKDYDAVAFAKDAKVFAAFIKTESPKTVFLGPGGVGEGVSLGPAGMNLKLIATEDILKATGPIFTGFSYHFYGGVSSRCMGKMTADQALSADWLDRTDSVEAFYQRLRDKYDPGAPMWLTETGEAACGGDQLAGQFIDTFRFVNQLGTLAQKGVQTVMRNTLAASDYSLLNEETLDPKPDYWAALLWKRTMGNVVLEPGVAKDQSLRVYAQCMDKHKGGVAVVALNTDRTREQSIAIPKGEEFVLTAPGLESAEAMLNGTELRAGADGSIPSMEGKPVKVGDIRIAPLSIVFFTFPDAHNQSCM
jgi:hypothetical protein